MLQLLLAFLLLLPPAPPLDASIGLVGDRAVVVVYTDAPTDVTVTFATGAADLTALPGACSGLSCQASVSPGHPLVVTARGPPGVVQARVRDNRGNVRLLSVKRLLPARQWLPMA